MTVKDVICDALCLLGKGEVANAITASVENGTSLDSEAKRYVKLFTLIADSVTKELYSGYFPDTMTCSMTRLGAGFHLSDLKYPLVRIREIVNTAKNEKIKVYTITDETICVGGVNNINLTYEYTSYDYNDLTDDIADFKRFITGDVIVTGMVAEYYCTIGDTVNAALWQERYENKIKLVLDSGLYKPYPEPEESAVRRVNLPCRRWV